MLGDRDGRRREERSVIYELYGEHAVVASTDDPATAGPLGGG